jgi:hypothetical protein
VTAPQRVVQRVRLRASSESLVRRGATLLEDALRTAASPMAGRVLVVRSLSVGSIRVGRSPAVVATAVEQRLRELATQAVHAGAQGSASAAAVYFRHETEPLLLLAVRIAEGASADEWFWPIAVRQWHHGMSRHDALRRIAYVANEDRAAPGTLASIVGELATRGTVDVLLSAIQYGDAARLMHGWVGTSSDLARTMTHGDGGRADEWRERASELTSAMGGVLERWIGRWGASDARTAWLAAMLLIAERRPLAGASDLLVRARRAILSAAARTGGTRGATPDAREHDNARSALDENNRVTSDDARPTDGSGPAASGAPTSMHSDPTSDVVASQPAGRPSPVTLPETERASADTPSVATDAPTARGHDDNDPRNRDVRRDNARAARAAQDGGVPTHRAAPIDATSHATEPDTMRDEESRADRARAPAGIPSQRNDAPSPPLRAGPRLPEGDVDTAYAGLFFLIPAMVRLGMGAFLESQPALLASDFPTRVLRDLARRLSIPAADPMWRAIEPVPGEFPPADWRGGFVMPDVWRELVTGPGPWLERRAGDGHVLTDGSWQLVLAHWRRRSNARVKAIAKGMQVRTGGAVRESVADLLVDSWRAALRRYCHRAAGAGVQAIVTRPGRIAVGRTHLEVVFNTRAVDIRVRRAALDVNPHWLPWLGRVVQFHYQPEARRAGDG